MNIFVLDKDPKIAAMCLCDKHVVKMVLESAQILCSVSWLRGIEAPYILTHKNHPIITWTNSSLGNYNWLLEHAFGICDEYHFRYERVHKSKDVIIWCQQCGAKPKVDVLTKFIQCMPDQYKSSNAIESYRLYYREEKSNIATWKRRKAPLWWANEQASKVLGGDIER